MTKIYSLKNTSLASSRQLPSISGRKLYSDRHIECICQYIFGHVDTCCLSQPQVGPLPIQWDVQSPHTLTYLHIFDPSKLKTQLPYNILTLTFDNCRRQTSYFQARWISSKWTTQKEEERHASKQAKHLDQTCAQTTIISGEQEIQIWTLQFGMAHSRPPFPSSSTSCSFSQGRLQLT